MQAGSRGVAVATVLTIALVAVVSGPLVGGVDLTAAQTDATTYDGGSITASEVTIPSEGYVFRQGDYGSAAYYLRTPDATVAVESVTGSPRLVYKLRVPEKRYVVAKTTFLRNDATGRVPIAGPQDTFEPGEIDGSSYRGEVLVLVRSGSDARVLARKNVTIEVQR